MMMENGNAGVLEGTAGGSGESQAGRLDASEYAPLSASSQASAYQDKKAFARAHDHQFRVAGDWALATDDIQWIVQHRRQRAGKVAWRPVSFVRSTKSVLGRCLLEKGAGTSAAATLLADLPETFDQWAAGGAVP